MARAVDEARGRKQDRGLGEEAEVHRHLVDRAAALRHNDAHGAFGERRHRRHAVLLARRKRGLDSAQRRRPLAISAA